MTGKRGLLSLVAGIALALLAGRWLSGRYGEWAFFHALGADAVWRAGLAVETGMRMTVFAGAFVFVFANFYAVRQSIVSLVLPRQLGNLEISEAIPTRRLTLLAFAGALALALLFTLLSHDWTVAALAFNGLPFVEIDPYFERDIGFYVYWLPFERALYSLITIVTLLTAAIVVALYASTPSVRWDERGLYVSTWVRRHLGLLGGLAIALVAWDWRLDRFGLLTDGHGEGQFIFDAPFGAFDHRVLVPYLMLISFGAIPIAVVFAGAVWHGYLRMALALVTVVIVGGPVARITLPLLAGEKTLTETARVRDRPYAATRILYTRRAFGVDMIVRPDGAMAGRLSKSEMARWVSSWDPAALVRYLEQERRGTDVAAFAWQTHGSGLEAVLLRAAPADAPPGTRWASDRLLTTVVDVRGLPAASPGAADHGVAGVLVAPGASRYALVADSTGHLAAPPFESTLQRVAQAWDQQNPRLLAMDAPTPRPRLVTHRDVHERLARIVPFLKAGPTVTPIVRGDSLYWVVELFAVAREYPLSVPLTFAGTRAHYVHHAATAVVQSQSGRVMLLAAMAPDPVTRSWMQLFPGLFTTRANAPDWLESALPPATDWALVQGAMLGRTGFPGDTTPVRSLALIDDADADLTGGPVTLFQFDSAGTTAWGIPVLGGTGTLSGLLTATGGVAPRTEFMTLPSARRWIEVLESLQVAADEAGFGRAVRDSRRGRVQAIPTDSGPAFTQSFYEWPAADPPRLAGVAVLIGDRRTVGRTLAEALGYRVPWTGQELSVDVLRARVAALYDAMGAALRAGDWMAYGEAWAALGHLLGRP